MADTSFVVPAPLNGERLDKVLAELVPGLSRARARRAVEEGAVRVDGRRVPKGGVVEGGARIDVAPHVLVLGDVPPLAEPEAHLNVVLETASFVVVDKPAGQPSAPLRADERGTLANALLGAYPEMAGVGYSPREPGLVHRLDTQTSGLLVAARNQEAFERLAAALRAGEMTKHYLLICRADGLPEEGTIEVPLAAHPKDQRRVLACIHPRDVMRNAPKAARTEYTVVETHGPWALVEARVAKALRHQIRAHFAAIEHPLLGDELYGGEKVALSETRASRGHALARHALHAARIACRSPKFDVTSPLPNELRALVEAGP
jgi:23S rRNA pseudouridine1911/1915/1917 synthase